MLLCLDIGNTQIYGGFYVSKKFKNFFRLNTKQGWSSDQLGLTLKMFCNEHKISAEKIEGILVSSVAPSIDHHLNNACLKYFGKQAFFLKSGVKTGISVSRFKHPSEIGADLISAAVGAVKLYPGKNIVAVDLGTATTVTTINARKEFLGGIIMPGIQTQIESITRSAEKLFNIEIKKPEKYIGLTTTHSLQSGIYYGHLNALKGIIKNSAQECFGKQDFLVIGTGGFSRMFEQEKIFNALQPDLVLLGLVEIYNLNT